MNLIISHRVLFLLLSTFLTGTLYAQQRINHIQKGATEKIEFRSIDGRAVNVIDINQNNRYSKLTYRILKKDSGVIYSLENVNKTDVLNSFFFSIKDKENFKKLDPSSLRANSDVILSENHVVVADHLTMYGREEGILGVKSVASVYDELGKKVATLPENNDGYYSPIVTKDGKYLATNYGDVSSHVDYSLLPAPGFRIYDLKNGNPIYEIQSTTDFDVLPPASRHNMIFEVLRFPNNSYEYLVFLPAQRIVYRKRFSGDQVDDFVRFSPVGFVIKDGGREVVLEYERVFSKTSF